MRRTRVNGFYDYFFFITYKVSINCSYYRPLSYVGMYECGLKSIALFYLPCEIATIVLKEKKITFTSTIKLASQPNYHY